MADQADVVAALEVAGKMSLKVGLTEVAKDGGALSMELDIVAAKIGGVAPEVLVMVKPWISEAVAALLAKMG